MIHDSFLGWVAVGGRLDGRRRHVSAAVVGGWRLALRVEVSIPDVHLELELARLLADGARRAPVVGAEVRGGGFVVAEAARRRALAARRVLQAVLCAKRGAVGARVAGPHELHAQGAQVESLSAGHRRLQARRKVAEKHGSKRCAARLLARRAPVLEAGVAHRVREHGLHAPAVEEATPADGVVREAVEEPRVEAGDAVRLIERCVRHFL
mmetsp:Transcript_20006/g.65179  ORF Transcript_20006/g.65179 Transcript_20006/m.65179 type:complete len:210 (-) Transcript_20006:14-643(-)